MPDFQQFIGVDWSGAKSRRLTGLQIASCGGDGDDPVPVPPSGAAAWTRLDAVDYLIAQAADHGPVLAGFDFGFAYPFEDRGAYFPGLRGMPSTAPDLWAMIERLSMNAPDLYGGRAALPPSPIAPFFNIHGSRGARFTNRRLRVTERLCPARPSCMFNGVGPGSVGIGSLAGMRMLHRMKQRRDLRIAVWPFDPVDGADLAAVEIFPRLYAKTTRYLREDYRSEDEYDAVVSAAALRELAMRSGMWRVPESAKREGWIFGVDPDRVGERRSGRR